MPIISKLLVGSVLLAGALGVVACSSSPGAESGATCDASLTYENFGKAFFQQHCLNCHDGAQRPTLATADAIRANRGEIDRQAAAGPNATNTAMPQGGSVSTDDRKKLGAWLACGAP